MSRRRRAVAALAVLTVAGLAGYAWLRDEAPAGGDAAGRAVASRGPEPTTVADPRDGGASPTAVLEGSQRRRGNSAAGDATDAGLHGPSCTLDVNVLRGGARVERAFVSVLGRGGLELRSTGEEPPFHFRGVPSGVVRVAACVRGGTDTEVEVHVVEGRANTAVVDIPDGGIEGRIRMAVGTKPVKGIHVRLYPVRDGVRAESWRNGVSVDENGFFAFHDVPATRYAVVVGEPGWTDGDDENNRRATSVRTAERTVDVREGAMAVADVEVEPAGAVTVHVRGPGGRLLEGAAVTVVLEGEAPPPALRWDRWMRQGGRTGFGGAVRLVGLAAGRYVAYADQSEFDDTASRPVDVAAGAESDATIRLKAADRARVHFTFEGPSGPVTTGVHVTLVDAEGREIRTDDSLGTTAILAPGRYRMRAEGDVWKTVERDIEIEGDPFQVVGTVLEQGRE